MTNSASSQLRTYGVGLLLGLAAVGYMQAASTLMAAFVVLVTGTGLILLPEATRIWRDAAERLVRFCAVISLVYTISAALCGAILLLALPRGLGQWLLGAIWEPTRPLMLPTVVGIMGFCVAAGAGTGLKGIAAAKHSLRAAIATSIMYVLFSLAGAVIAGTRAAVWGTSLAMWCGALVYWWQFLVAMRESAASTRAGFSAAPRHGPIGSVGPRGGAVSR